MRHELACANRHGLDHDYRFELRAQGQMSQRPVDFLMIMHLAHTHDCAKILMP